MLTATIDGIKLRIENLLSVRAVSCRTINAYIETTTLRLLSTEDSIHTAQSTAEDISIPAITTGTREISA